MTENPIPDNTLSEETRQMIYEQLNPKTVEAYKSFFDQLMQPKTVQPPTANSLLADRVKRIATDLYLSGDEYGANVLYEAAEAIRGMA